MRTQRNRPRSVSSCTEALESDHARYITRRIAQHARSMATSTPSLPTDSPVPYFQPTERGYMSEGSQEGVYAPPYVNPLEQTGLDDYDTLFAARHGREALDPVPRMSEQMIMTTFMGITPPTVSMGLMVNPLERVMPAHDIAHSSQREQVSIPEDSLKHRVVSPSSEIMGRVLLYLLI